MQGSSNERPRNDSVIGSRFPVLCDFRLGRGLAGTDN